MRLYVGNFSYSVTEAELLAMLSEYGPVSDLHLAIDRDTRKSKGFAFCELPDEDAQRAMVALDGVEWYGRPLRVSEAHARPQRTEGQLHRSGKPREAARR